MATPTELDLKAYYKSDETFSGVINDDNGDPLDLTGGGSVNVQVEIAAQYGATPVVSKSLAGTTVTGGSVGDYSFTLADTDWNALPLSGPQREWWITVWHTNSSGTRVPKARGKLTVKGTVSS